MYLGALTQEQCEKVRQWRNESMESLRTPYMLTRDQQIEFYRNVICDRNSRHRYFAIYEEPLEYPCMSVSQNAPPVFIGMGGLTNIEWENGCAEISLILDPEKRGLGHGRRAVGLLLREGFNNMRLENIYGEVYECNDAYDFWERVIDNYDAFWVILPSRKFYDGEHHDSMYFNISRCGFEGAKNDNP